MKTLAFVVFCSVLTSCMTIDLLKFGSSNNPPPAAQSATSSDSTASPPPASDKAKADSAEWDRYAQAVPSTKSFAGASDSSTLLKRKIKGGEWASYRVTENGKMKSLYKMAVAGQDGDAWIYEFVVRTDKDTSVFQEAVQGLDAVIQSGDANQGKVVWVKVRNKEGKVMTIDGAMLAMGGDAYKSMLTANSAEYTSTITSGGTVAVPAGTFSGTWKVDSRMAQGKSSEMGQAWVSDAVPLWHLVKSVNKDGSRVLELVDFGTSGYIQVLQ